MTIAYNITASTVVKATPGTVKTVSIMNTGTVAGTVNDTTTTGGASASNATLPLPPVVGTTIVDRVCLNGIVVVPGSGQTIVIEYF